MSIFSLVAFLVWTFEAAKFLQNIDLAATHMF